MSANIWPIAAIIISLVGVLVSIGTFVRAGQWRVTDDGKKVLHRLGNVEMQVRGLEVQAERFANKEDVTRIEGRLDGMERTLEAVEAGINRIEDYFLRKGTA